MESYMGKDPLCFPLPVSKFQAFRKLTSHHLVATVTKTARSIWVMGFLSRRVAWAKAHQLTWWAQSCWWYCLLLSALSGSEESFRKFGTDVDYQSPISKKGCKFKVVCNYFYSRKNENCIGISCIRSQRQEAFEVCVNVCFSVSTHGCISSTWHT